MRELGDKLGLFVSDCILLFFVDQYQHLNMKSNNRLYGDPTSLIREFVVHHKGVIPPVVDERRFHGKRVPIPAKLITKYMKDNRVPLESMSSVESIDIIDHCFPHPEEGEFDTSKFRMLEWTDLFPYLLMKGRLRAIPLRIKGK